MTLCRRLCDLEARAAWSDTPVAIPARVAPAPVETPADLLAVLAEQINLARADAAAEPQERARTVAGLAAVAVRVMEAGEKEARLAAVERVLRLRRDQERDRGRRGGR